MPLPDPRKLTAQRIQRTEAYAAKIQRMFSETVNELLSLPLTLQPAGVGQMYSFDAENERTQRRVEQLLRRLHSATLLAIEKGVDIEWERANKDADDILKSYFVRKARRSPMMRGWNARNDDARRQFLARSDRGMNLSDRVWQPCRQLRDEMEVALTVAIGEGQDAGTISRSIRRSLNDPDLMFRRFRYKDADGRWQRKWKKRIKDPDRPGKYRFVDYDKDTYKDQWTGRGYYKSAAQNAMRVARTETNIAYRRADNERWQGLDFVLGQRIQLSKSHPEEDICDTLAGDYPKEFVFDGWHPQCFCFVTPILPSSDEMAKMNEAFLRGEQYTPKGKPVTEYPAGFRQWVKANETKIAAARKRGTEPYFIRNNADIVDGLLNEPRAADASQVEELNMKLSALPDEQQREIRNRIKGLPYATVDLRSACQRYGIDITHFDDIVKQIMADPENNWKMINAAETELQRLESECDRHCTMDKQTAINIEQNFENALLEAAKWIEMTTPMAERKKLSMALEVAKNARWGDFSAIINSKLYRDAYADEIMLARADWEDMKLEADKLIGTINDTTQTAKLVSLVAEQPSSQRPAYKIAEEILIECERLNAANNPGNPKALDDVFAKLDKFGVSTKNVRELDKALTESEIIERISGGDKTKGSCASVALAYAANKCGLDVLDFRGGMSRSIFCKNRTLDAIAEFSGGTVIKKENDYDAASELMGMMEEGKEYYFGVGKHVAIVRKTSTGYEYLELQSETSNGFKELTQEQLEDRFGCQRSHSRYGKKYEIASELIELSRFTKSDKFKKLLSYLNTSKSKQSKGKGGTTK